MGVTSRTVWVVWVCDNQVRLGDNVGVVEKLFTSNARAEV